MIIVYSPIHVDGLYSLVVKLIIAQHYRKEWLSMIDANELKTEVAECVKRLDVIGGHL